MATKKMMRILAGMAIAPLCGAIVAALSCSPSDVGNGGNSDRGDTLCPNKADCPEITDGGNADAGTPDGSRLDVVLLRAVFNGRYAFVDPQSGNTKTSNVEVKVCNTVHYPQTEVCLFTTTLGGREYSILPDWSMMNCMVPLTANGQCPAAESRYWEMAHPYLCNCQALTEISGVAAGAECERRQDLPREECDKGGGVVIVSDHYSNDDPEHPYSHIPQWKYMQ